MKDKKNLDEKEELEEDIEESKLKKVAEEINNENPEDIEKIEDNNFHEFFETSIKTPTIQKSSPSLEKINISQEIPVRLEQGFTDSQFTEKESKGSQFKYNFTNQKEEPKYQTSEEQTFAPQRTNIESLGKTEFPQRQEAGFIHAQENNPTQIYEKYVSPSSQEIEELGKKENLFEKKEIKYKPSTNH